MATTGSLHLPIVPTTEPTPMAQSILVHITHGPEHPTRAALGFAVAHAALEQGHTVTVFLAGSVELSLEHDRMFTY